MIFGLKVYPTLTLNPEPPLTCHNGNIITPYDIWEPFPGGKRNFETLETPTQK
jgi:hypothetical protein